MQLNKIIVPVLMGCGMVAAFARELVVAYSYGVSREVEIFRIAYALPNLLSFSVGTAFVSVAVPMIVKAQKNGTSQELQVCSGLLRINVAFVFFVVAWGMLTSGWQARIFAPGFDSASLASLTTQIRWCWLLFLGVGLSFTSRAVLNVNGIFWPSVCNNLIKAGVFIVVLYPLGVCFGPFLLHDVSLLTILTVLSGLLILLVNGVAMFYYKVSAPYHFVLSRFSFHFTHRDIASLYSLLAVVLYQLFNVAPTFLDRAYASHFQEGVVASFDYSYGLVVAIAAILGTSFNTVMLPGFARLVGLDSKWKEYDKFVKEALAIVVLSIVLGVAIAIIVEDIVNFVFVHGSFTLRGAHLTSALLRWHALGIPFMILGSMATQVLIVFGIHARLVLVGVVKLLLKVIFLTFLIPSYGMVSLGISFLLVEAVMAIVLCLGAFYMIRATNK